MSPKYYEVVPISEKPEKDGWYDLINPEGVYKSTSAYFSDGEWSKIEPYEKENYSHYYRPLTSFPIDRIITDLENAIELKTNTPENIQGLKGAIGIVRNYQNKTVLHPIDRDTAEKIWEAGAKAQLKLLADSLQNEKYVVKFGDENDKILLRSLGKQLGTFPLPDKETYLKQIDLDSTSITGKITEAIEKIKGNLFQNENNPHKSSYNVGVRDALEILEPLINKQ